MTAQKILIDTSVILEGGEDIIAKLDKVAPVFVTDIVLQELDGHKNNANGAVAYQAREFFRRLGKTNGEALDVLPPDGMKLEKTDTLRRMTLGSTPLHVIVRKPYKSRDINDSKIIEVAKDYNMTLVTLDMAQRVRGLSDGVEAVTLESILPNKSFKEDAIQMSEMEKIIKQEEKQTQAKNKKREKTIKLIIFALVLSIIISYTPMNETMVFVIGTAFFASIAIFGEPVSNTEFERRYGKPTFKNSNNIHSTPDYINDPQYSSLSGNIYHSEN